MTVALVTFGKKGTRKDFDLKSGAFVIGRRTNADLRIPLAEVSRSHCEIMVNGNNITLRDLGSSNGTFVNDHKITEATLNPGDRIAVGPVTFTIQIDGIPKEISPITAAAKAKAAPEAPTRTDAMTEAAPEADIVDADASDSDVFDIDEIGELDIDDLSDLDLDEIGADDTSDLEEIDNLEEIDESDLILDDEAPDESPKS